MKIVFLSNFFTPHQLPLSNCLYKETNGEFWFIENDKVDKSALPIGWLENETPDYLITKEYWEAHPEEIAEKLNSADVVILGSANENIIKDRIKNNKLTFRYSERFYKKGTPFSKWLRDFIAAYIHHGKYRKNNFYLLCASAYTAGDAARFNNYKNKCYKWGYFPFLKKYENSSELFTNKEPTVILSVARPIDWKHHEVAVQLADRLKKAGYDFTLNIIGDGDFSMYEKLAKDLSVTDKVNFLGAMPPEKVREYMDTAGIFIFTSDFSEGWGAVLNEAMNSGCAAVASHAVGSAPFLIKDGENGFLYENGNLDDLYNKVSYLLGNPEKATELGIAAGKTVTEQWNEAVAAKRLVALSNEILKGNKHPDLFSEGPLSISEIRKNNWYKSNFEG